MDRNAILRARDLLNEALQPRCDNRVADFVASEMHTAPGRLLPFSEFYRRFIKSIPGEERLGYSKARVAKELREICTLHNGTGNILFVRDVTFDEKRRASVPKLTELRFVRFDDGSGFFSRRDSSGTWTRVAPGVLRTILRGQGHDSDAIKAALIHARANPISFRNVAEAGH